MWPKNRFFRPFFATIFVCFLLLAIGTGVFVWRATQATSPTLPTPAPTPPQGSCGTILYHTNIDKPITERPQVQAIMNCFVQAYQQCAAKSMEIHHMGVDTGSNTLYWPQQQGNACRIFAQSKDYGLVGAHPVTTDTCQSVQLKSFGLLLQGCGKGGDISLYM